MIHGISQRTLIVLSFALGLVFVLTRILTVMSHFHAAEVAPLLAPVMAMPKPVAKAIPHPVKAPITHSEAVITTHPMDINSLHLNTNLKEYNVIFAGHVLCKQGPCQAELDIKMSTVRNENMHRVIPTMEDGNFWVQIPVTENMNEHIDWKITARFEDDRTAEAHGRDILSEDAVVSIDAPITLH